MSDHNKIKQEDLDNLADIIWWIKGYEAGAKESFESCPFNMEHIESLRKSRLALEDMIDEDELMAIEEPRLVHVLEGNGCIIRGQELLTNHEPDTSKPCKCGRPLRKRKEVELK